MAKRKTVVERMVIDTAQDSRVAGRIIFVVCKRMTAYRMRISVWSSDVCSSDLPRVFFKKELANPGLNLSVGCRTALADFAGGSDNSFADIKKTITNVLGLWLNPLVDAATEASDFDLRQLRKRPMSISLGASPD